jgi:hypothetical protein
MGQAKATKTIRQPLEHRPTVSAWFVTPQTLFNAVASFYWQVLDAHLGVLDLSSKQALTAVERLILTTGNTPAPVIVMPLSAVAEQVPALFRRAAIHAALGSMRSFQSHLTRWQRANAKAAAKGKRCQVGPPVPPRGWNRSVVLYAGMWQQATNGRITLKLYDGQTWRWVGFRIQGRLSDPGSGHCPATGRGAVPRRYGMGHGGGCTCRCAVRSKSNPRRPRSKWPQMPVFSCVRWTSTSMMRWRCAPFNAWTAR